MPDKDKPADGLDEHFKVVNDNMIDGLGKLSEYFGFNKVMGQLYAVCYLSPRPLSLDDLAAQLTISKASVSTNMRTLEQFGMVREVWVRGERRKYYEAETDFWSIVENILRSRELRDIEQALAVLRQSTDHLRDTMPDMDADAATLAEFYINRIDSLQDFFRFAQLMLNTLLQKAGTFDISEVTGPALD